MVAEIGRGARSVVFHARRDRRQFAVKVASAGASELGERERKQFRREAALLGCLRHPGLPAVVDVGEVEGRPYIVMEHVAGQTLEALLVHGPLSEARVIRLAKTIAGALAEVHRHDVVHRDVKPQNIIVGPDGEATLIDFGFATRSSPLAPSAPEVAGTLLYCAPEQSGILRRPVDGRADLYALGAVLYECATGAPPFAASDAAEVARRHAFEPLPPVYQPRLAITRAMGQIIEHLLAKDPDDRYRSGLGLIADLTRIDALNAQLERGESVTLDSLEIKAERAPFPLVGRDTDLGLLESRLLEVRRGGAHSAVVMGELGVGKTRLLEGLIERAKSHGMQTLIARCQGDSRIPLRPLRDALEHWADPRAWSAAETWRLAVDAFRQAASEGGPSMRVLSPAIARILGDASDTPPNAPSAEQFMAALAATLARLAELLGGLLIVVDDAQYLDDPSLRVLAHLIEQHPGAPVLIASTFRSDAEGTQALVHLEREMGPPPNTIVTLGVLPPQSIIALATHVLRRPLRASLANTLEACSQGNPYTLLEYIRALLDEGILRPTWSGWEVYAEELDGLHLPTNVLELLTQRVAALDTQTRDILRIASLLGPNLTLDRLTRCWRRGPERAVDPQRPIDVADKDCAAAIASGLSCHLLTRADKGDVRFVHGHAAKALLTDTDEAGLRALHQRIAETLDAEQEHADDTVFSLARHYALGETTRTPKRVFETSWAAGVRALSVFAAEEAYRHLDSALRFAQQTGLPVTADHEEKLGLACAMVKRPVEARTHYENARRLAATKLQRARLGSLIGRVHLDALEMRNVRRIAREVLVELDAPLLAERWKAIPVIGWLALTVSLSDFDRPPPATPPTLEERTRWRVLTNLYNMQAGVEYFAMNPLGSVQSTLRAIAAARRAGPSYDSAVALGHLAVAQTIVGLWSTARRTMEVGTTLATRLGDPVALAHCRIFSALVTDFTGAPVVAARQMARHVEEQGNWVEVKDYLIAIVTLSWNLMMRGYVAEALNWTERGFRECRRNASSAESVQVTLLLQSYRVSLLACCGRLSEAVAILPELRAQVAESEAGAFFSASLLGHLLIFHLEQNELGPPLEDAVREFEALGQNPSRATLHNSHFYIIVAYARLAQLSTAVGAERTLRGKQTRDALRTLRKVPDHPTLKAHATVIEAALCMAEGQTKRALTLLSAAEDQGREIDSPWVAFEIARLRALHLLERGNPSAAQREARMALMLAQQHGWVMRARALRTRFHLADTYHEGTSATRSTARAGSSSTEQLKLERQLDALMQLGLASVKVTDPEQQASVALDEIVRLLGAERASLFLFEEESETLRLVATRGTGAADTLRLSAYSSKVVNEVWDSGLPVVVSGSEDAEILGSVSAIMYDLRSIMAAPLRVRDLTIGVLYLDTRIARGMFTRQDIDILVVMANHIAITLETARAARLEAEIATEQEQRLLAERMRASTASMASSLDLSDVLRRLMEGASTLVSFERAVAALWNGERFEGSSALGFNEHEPSPGWHHTPVEGDVLHRLAVERKPIMVVDPSADSQMPTLGGWKPLGTWLGVPIAAREQLVGLLCLEASPARTFDERSAAVVFTLASQAGVAVENARLFAEVQRLATTDALTGLFNRRHFFATAERELERAVRYQRSVSAIMLDVDHFKRFNDTYGHAVGDEVLRVVARCCREVVRNVDVVGRYGGEEFGVLVPEMSLDEACTQIAERIRARISETQVDTEHGALSVSVSLGVSAWRTGDDLSNLLKRADEALYRAKANGRNRVEAG